MSAPALFAFLTPPNLLSLARLPLGWLFWIALGPTATPAHAGRALGVMAVAALTDVLDGTLARRRGVDISGAGSWLDPICDKLFVGAVLAALHFERGVSFGTLALIVARELLQLPLVVVYRASHTLRRWLRYDFRASLLGKAATVVQFLAIAALIVAHLGVQARWLAYLAFALGVGALADYLRRAVALGRTRLHDPGEPQRP
jgi:phosphatidylglycerophosphate synthase